ncbi:MAG: flagellar basal body-associated FliL family protein [Candidatus Glassbacteria bacterium]|nr:flagellar basal body-associated FliL family protein [Candidatus Glassbacteria bacterium]
MAQDPEEMTEEGTEEQEQPSSKSKLSPKTLVLIGLPLVMVQAVLAYFVVSNYIEPQLPETKPLPAETQAAEGRLGGDIDDLSEFVTFAVEDVIANPAETGGQRYLSVSINVYIQKEYADEMADMDAEFRSLIIARISRKRMDELDDFKDQEILREELKDDINALIGKYFSKKYEELEVPRVVFSKYTIQ